MFSPHDFELCQSMLYHLYWICVIYEVDHDHILFYWLSILLILLSMWNLLVNLYLWTCLCLCTCLCYYRCLCKKNKKNKKKLGHGCWCPAASCCQGINRHGIDYVGSTGLLKGRISSTCTIKMVTDETKYKYCMFLCFQNLFNDEFFWENSI